MRQTIPDISNPLFAGQQLGVDEAVNGRASFVLIRVDGFLSRMNPRMVNGVGNVKPQH